MTGNFLAILAITLTILIRTLSDGPHLDYFHTYEFYFLVVAIVLILTILPWWIFHAKPGKGWVYIPELGEHIDEEWAAVWYEEQLARAYDDSSYYQQRKEDADRSISYYEQRVAEKNRAQPPILTSVKSQ